MKRHVVVTGALGNLGQKLIRHLASHPEIGRITGIDAQSAPEGLASALRRSIANGTPESPPAELAFVTGDMRNWDDRHWREPVDACHTIVHLAAQVPNADATWDDAAVSLDMNLNAGLAAVRSKTCRRLVFASSNHVMGRYKDEPLASALEPGSLRPDSPYAVGTLVDVGFDNSDSTAYAVAKFAGERLYRALALSDVGVGDTEFVAIRIGWCNAGDNHPASLTPTGSPRDGSPAPDFAEAYQRADRWFKEMWLANPDFVHLLEKAICADSEDWPLPYLCVNGMSDNAGMPWSLDATRDQLGYAPQEDAYRHIPPFDSA